MNRQESKQKSEEDSDSMENRFDRKFKCIQGNCDGSWNQWETV